VLFWTVLSLFGALPLMLGIHPHFSWIDAVFESVSGFTTTGASVLTGLDELPNSIRYYRQQLHFVGGMGIVVLAVAILPMLGVGGMQLYRAETPGPIKDTKLTPRITETAKALWSIYLGLNVFCAVAFKVAGMPWFDAIGESISTISTGGFTMHDASFAYYQSPLIEMIAAFFMILGATNFSLHFFAFQDRSYKHYWADEEFRTFIKIILASILLIAGALLTYQYYSPKVAILQSVFTAISIATTTGFISGSFDAWPTFVPFLIVLIGMVGGCGGSTSGGIKVIRLLLLHKQGLRELKRLIHPRAVFTIKIGSRVLPEHVIQAIWGYTAVVFLLFVILILILIAIGLEPVTAFAALIACLSNTGAAIADVATGYGDLASSAKGVLIFAMLVAFNALL